MKQKTLAWKQSKYIFMLCPLISVTVNNVGKQYAYPMYLGEVPQQELWDIVNINIGATTMMTRIILPQMQKRRKGAIVNVSSGSELQPLPLMTVYAASKAWIRFLKITISTKISIKLLNYISNMNHIITTIIINYYYCCFFCFLLLLLLSLLLFLL